MQKFSLDAVIMAANDLRDREPNLRLVNIKPRIYGLIFETEDKRYFYSYVFGNWRVKNK